MRPQMAANDIRVEIGRQREGNLESDLAFRTVGNWYHDHFHVRYS